MDNKHKIRLFMKLWYENLTLVVVRDENLTHVYVGDENLNESSN